MNSFPGYGNLEGIDESTWPLFLIGAIIFLLLLLFVGVRWYLKKHPKLPKRKLPTLHHKIKRLLDDD